MNNIKFRFVFFSIFVLSSLLYINLAVAQKYGESQFYSVIEHVAVLIYSCLSYYITNQFIKYFQKEPQTFSNKNYIKIIIYSGLTTTFISSAFWVLLRFLAFYFANKDGWFISWSYIVPNALFIFFYIHLVISGCYLAYHYLNRVKISEINRIEAEKATDKAKFKLLQKQITPHFLFNNLNVLSSLITIDPQLAEIYVTKFADLYRYMLRNKERDLVSLQGEILFITDYVDLVNVRFNDAYKLSFNITKDINDNHMVVPCALQTLVENAIKHNNASPENPLIIEVNIFDDFIQVKNQMRDKPSNIQSTGTGLENLQQRYKSLSFKKVSITNIKNLFCVEIPLIEEVYENSHY